MTITVPVGDDPHGVREIIFPTAQFDASQQVLTAVLPLSTFGLREQLIAAFGSLEANATLIIARTISVAVPTGTTFPNGEKAYVNRDFVLETMVPPSPLILSERHRDRLAGHETSRLLPRIPPPLALATRILKKRFPIEGCAYR